MGVWDEDGERIWLPREHYPRRIDAIRFAMDEWCLSLPEVRCLSRWMVYAPFVGENLDGSVAYTEDYWAEVPKGMDGAFPVWRLEAA